MFFINMEYEKILSTGTWLKSQIWQKSGKSLAKISQVALLAIALPRMRRNLQTVIHLLSTIIILAELHLA